jgi:hypothetical protein
MLCLCAAGWSWSDHADAPPPPATTADPVTQGDYNRAACTTFGLVMRRTQAAVPAVALLGIDPGLSDFTPWLPREVFDLDAIARRFPGTDYRLVDTLSQVADAGALLLASDSRATLRDRVTQHADAVDDANSACRTIGDFDAHRLLPIAASS